MGHGYKRCHSIDAKCGELAGKKSNIQRKILLLKHLVPCYKLTSFSLVKQGTVVLWFPRFLLYMLLELLNVTCPLFVSCFPGWNTVILPGTCVRDGHAQRLTISPALPAVTWWSLCVWVHGQNKEKKKKNCKLKERNQTKAATVNSLMSLP